MLLVIKSEKFVMCEKCKSLIIYTHNVMKLKLIRSNFHELYFICRVRILILSLVYIYRDEMYSMNTSHGMGRNDANCINNCGMISKNLEN